MSFNPNINCKQASFLISKKQEDGISLWQKAQLKIHLAKCTACVLFKKQTDFLVNYLSKINKANNFNTPLSDNKKDQLKQQLQSLMQDDK